MSLMNKKIWIIGISDTTTDELLRNVFSCHGSIEDVEIIHTKEYAFVTFEDENDRNRFVACMQVGGRMMLDDKEVEVKIGERYQNLIEESKSEQQHQAQPSPPSNNRIFVGGLVPSVHTTDTLRAYFSQYGNISDIKTFLGTPNDPRYPPYCFVTFNDSSAFYKAIEQIRQIINGFPVTIKTAHRKKSYSPTQQPEQHTYPEQEEGQCVEQSSFNVPVPPMYVNEQGQYVMSPEMAYNLFQQFIILQQPQQQIPHSSRSHYDDKNYSRSRSPPRSYDSRMREQDRGRERYHPYDSRDRSHHYHV